MLVEKCEGGWITTPWVVPIHWCHPDMQNSIAREHARINVMKYAKSPLWSTYGYRISLEHAGSPLKAAGLLTKGPRIFTDAKRSVEGPGQT